MSDTEDFSEEYLEGEVKVSSQYAAPISALAPRATQLAENQVGVSSSPAFQVLDQLFQDGKLTGTKVALLKSKYTELHDTLKSTKEHEFSLLQQCKEYTQELDQQKLELEKADDFPESANTEVGKLRQTLLNHSNELAQCDERQYELTYKIQCLEEEKKMIEREYARMPKEEIEDENGERVFVVTDVKKKAEELAIMKVELTKEIHQRTQEVKVHKEDLDNKNRQLQKEEKDLAAHKEELEKFKSDLVAVNATPGMIAKECDKINRQKSETQKKIKDIDAQTQSLMDQVKKLNNEQEKLHEEKLTMDRDVDRQAARLGQKESDYQVLMKDYEYAKEREAVLMGDKATLELNLRHINLEKKSTHDVHSRKVREKDRELRNLKKAELQNRVMMDSKQNTQLMYDKVKGSMDAMPSNDGNVKKKDDLQRDVEQSKRSFAQQNALTAVETVKVEQSIAEEERLLYEQSDLRIEVVELTRLAAIKNDEREQKARDFMRAEMRYHRAIQDLKTKELSIHDHQKKHNEMQVKLKEFAKLYDVIKNERNKCVNLIQTSTQKSAEMREKIKILQNEIEILRTAVGGKDRQLQKQRLKHANALVVRDSLRNEQAKQHRIDEEMNEKREQQRMDIAKLNLLINQAEEQMVKLRKRYENAVQHRNDRGIQLIEREEEVCVFYERLNIQEQMIRNGDVELHAREEEIRFLDMQKSEEKRSIGLLNKTLPNKQHLEQELVTLQIQLSQCQDRMLELEKWLENPNDPDRVRYIEGKDLTPSELHFKLEELEVRLAEKEENLLEKDLIFEQVSRLSGRVKKQADSGKTDTLQLAKKVNELQAKIKDVTRRMMAIVSELSMHQANAMKLQQEVKGKESDLEQCYMRMEKGEPPSEEIEREWLRTIRDEDRRVHEKEAALVANEEEEQYTLPGGVVTTAEPRPNAYIPDDEAELPIPRPYGSNAPFKPTDTGSTMRHIRKPIPKPIEI